VTGNKKLDIADMGGRDLNPASTTSSVPRVPNDCLATRLRSYAKCQNLFPSHQTQQLTHARTPRTPQVDLLDNATRCVSVWWWWCWGGGVRTCIWRAMASGCISVMSCPLTSSQISTPYDLEGNSDSNISNIAKPE